MCSKLIQKVPPHCCRSPLQPLVGVKYLGFEQLSFVAFHPRQLLDRATNLTCAVSRQLDAERTSFKARGVADFPVLTVFGGVREKMMADRPLRSDARNLRVHSS